MKSRKLVSSNGSGSPAGARRTTPHQSSSARSIMAERGGAPAAGATERQCQSGASPGSRWNQRDTYCLPDSITVSSTCNPRPPGRRAIQRGSIEPVPLASTTRSARRFALPEPCVSAVQNASHSLTRRITEQPQDVLALSQLHSRLLCEPTPQHVLEQSAGAGVHRDAGNGPRQPSRGEAHRCVRGRIERNRAARDHLVPPAGRQFVEGGCSRGHEKVKAAALGHAAARRGRGGSRIRGIAMALENRHALESTGEGMCGQQSTNSATDDHGVAIHAWTAMPRTF